MCKPYNVWCPNLSSSFKGDWKSRSVNHKTNKMFSCAKKHAIQPEAKNHKDDKMFYCAKKSCHLTWGQESGTCIYKPNGLLRPKPRSDAWLRTQICHKPSTTRPRPKEPYSTICQEGSSYPKSSITGIGWTLSAKWPTCPHHLKKLLNYDLKGLYYSFKKSSANIILN